MQDTIFNLDIYRFDREDDQFSINLDVSISYYIPRQPETFDDTTEIIVNSAKFKGQDFELAPHEIEFIIDEFAAEMRR